MKHISDFVLKFIYSFQFEQVWKSHRMYFASVIMKKHSPYTKFFKHGIYNMIFNGQLDIYTKRNSKSQSECHEERSKGDALGMEKLATLFLILILGGIISLSLFIVELWNSPKNSNKKQMCKIPENIQIELKILNQTNSEMEEYLCEKTEEFLNKLLRKIPYSQYQSK